MDLHAFAAWRRDMDHFIHHAECQLAVLAPRCVPQLPLPPLRRAQAAPHASPWSHASGFGPRRAPPGQQVQFYAEVSSDGKLTARNIAAIQPLQPTAAVEGCAHPPRGTAPDLWRAPAARAPLYPCAIHEVRERAAGSLLLLRARKCG
eukprot:gene26822-64536_t